MRLISEDAIQRKADNFGLLLELSSSPSQAQVSSLATFIHHGYITDVQSLWLRNIDLSEVAHASSLADVNVTNNVFILNVTGNISALISKVNCNMLIRNKHRGHRGPRPRNADQCGGGGAWWWPCGARHGHSPHVLTYDGRGLCGVVQCCGETGERYGDQLATWGETMGWSVVKDTNLVEIERN